MKKLTALLLVLIIVLCSCTNNTEPETNETTTKMDYTMVDGAHGTVLAPVYDDVDKNPYKPELFVSDGKFLSYSGDENYIARRGIDVSEFQGDVDWTAVKSDGIEFVILRLGFRGWGEAGTIKTDSKFHENIQEAQANGLDVGVYFFSQAINITEAIYEADYCIHELNGYTLQMPIFFDWEHVANEEARTNNISKETVNNCAVAFCERIKQYDQTPGVYFYQSIAYDVYDLSMLKQYFIWHGEPGAYPKLHYALNMWQYSFEGDVAGISTVVDLNLHFIKQETQITEQTENNG